jgi:hypothetical protein
MKGLKWIRNNIDLKVWAVILALIVWFHVATERTYDTTYRARLNFVNPPKGWTIVGSPPSEVSLRLRGTGKQLISNRLYGEPLATVELPSDKSYHVKMELSPEDIILARRGGLEVTHVLSPSQVDVEMDTVVRKSVPIEPLVQGTPREHFVQVGKPRIRPDEVELLGGRSRIRTIVGLNTEPVSIEGETRAVERTVAVSLPREAGFRSKPDSVIVTVSIERMAERILDGVPIKITGLDRGRSADIRTESVRVTLSCPESMTDLADTVNVTLSLDLKGLPRGPHLLPPKVTRPDNFKVVSIDPKVISIFIK